MVDRLDLIMERNGRFQLLTISSCISEIRQSISSCTYTEKCSHDSGPRKSLTLPASHQLRKGDGLLKIDRTLPPLRQTLCHTPFYSVWIRSVTEEHHMGPPSCLLYTFQIIFPEKIEVVLDGDL